jgi:hypothetical protein
VLSRHINVIRTSSHPRQPQVPFVYLLKVVLSGVPHRLKRSNKSCMVHACALLAECGPVTLHASRILRAIAQRGLAALIPV